MSVISKVRGLWRWDGDDAPVLVSRRSFLFLGGVVAAGAVVPGVFAIPEELTAAQVSALFKERYRDVIPSLYKGMPYHWDRTGKSWMNLRRVDVRAMTIPKRIG